MSNLQLCIPWNKYSKRIWVDDIHNIMTTTASKISTHHIEPTVVKVQDSVPFALLYSRELISGGCTFKRWHKTNIFFCRFSLGAILTPSSLSAIRVLLLKNTFRFSAKHGLPSSVCVKERKVKSAQILQIVVHFFETKRCFPDQGRTKWMTSALKFYYFLSALPMYWLCYRTT